MSEQILERPSSTGTGPGVLPGMDSEAKGPSSRKRGLVIVLLAIVAGLVLGGAVLLLMPSGAQDEGVDPLQVAAAAAAAKKAQAQAEAETQAAAGDVVVNPTRVKLTSRDPFEPLVAKPAPVVVKPKAPAAPTSSTPTTASGATISALAISPLGDSAALKLDGKKYEVDEGESFAKSYRLYDIFNDNCAGFLYGDQNVVVCEGDTVTVG